MVSPLVLPWGQVMTHARMISQKTMMIRPSPASLVRVVDETKSCDVPGQSVMGVDEEEWAAGTLVCDDRVRDAACCREAYRSRKPT